MQENFQTNDAVFELVSTLNHHSTDYYCAKLSGLFHSSDESNEWNQLLHHNIDTTTLPILTVAVAFSKSNTATIFAGTSGSVLRSSDFGKTWSNSQLPSPPPAVIALAVSPNFANDGIVFAGTIEDGVFRSGDGGKHFYAWNFGLLDLNILSLVISPAFDRDEMLFSGTESGIFRSTNGGRAWREIGEQGDARPQDFAPVLSLALSPDFPLDGTLFAGSEEHGVFESHDRGNSWHSIRWNLPDAPANRILADKSPSGKITMVLVSGNAIYRTTDKEKHWQALDIGQDVPPECLCDDEMISAALAPKGIDVGFPLILGTNHGRLLMVNIL